MNFGYTGIDKRTGFFMWNGIIRLPSKDIQLSPFDRKVYNYNKPIIQLIHKLNYWQIIEYKQTMQIILCIPSK